MKKLISLFLVAVMTFATFSAAIPAGAETNDSTDVVQRSIYMYNDDDTGESGSYLGIAGYTDETGTDYLGNGENGYSHVEDVITGNCTIEFDYKFTANKSVLMVARPGPATWAQTTSVRFYLIGDCIFFVQPVWNGGSSVYENWSQVSYGYAKIADFTYNDWHHFKLVSTHTTAEETNVGSGNTAAVYIDDVQVLSADNWSFYQPKTDAYRADANEYLTNMFYFQGWSYFNVGTLGVSNTALSDLLGFACTPATHGPDHLSDGVEYIDNIYASSPDSSLELYDTFDQYYDDSEGTLKNDGNILYSESTASTIVIESAPAGAEIINSGTCGNNLTWTLDSEGVLTISGTGDMTDYESTYNSSSPFQYITSAPWGEYYSSVKTANISSGVTSIGSSAFFGCKYLRSITIPDSVTSIGFEAFSNCQVLISITIPDSVTSIGDYAFRGCHSLTSITIPNSVTSIGEYAFLGCSSLERITVDTDNPVYHSNGNCLIETETKALIAGCKNSIIPSDGSVTSIGGSAFYKCYSLTSVTIPDSVMSIGDSAFSWCTSLTSITIPDNVTSIVDYAFSYCTGLTSVAIPDGVTSIGSFAFSYCTGLTNVTIPDSVTSIGSNAFSSCHSLTSITIPNSVMSIGDYAFSYCTGLTSVAIPDGVTSIGSFVFYNCAGLTSVTIPNSVTSIGDYAFRDCTGLTSITIPDSVTSIGYSAFKGCNSIIDLELGTTSIYLSSVISDSKAVLKNVTLLDQVTSIPNSFFSGFVALESVTIPDSVTSIGSYAFSDCSSLASVTIGNGVTSIGSGSFSYCRSLTSITIPDSVTSIGNYAFSGCDSLASVTIPDSVTSIGNQAFSYCRSLTSITIPDSVTEIGDGAFAGCDSLCYNTYGNAEYLGSGTNLYFALIGAAGNITSCAINENTKVIADGAFSYCRSLTSITIPDSVTSIGGYAFEYCSSLTRAYIGNGIESFGGGVFSGCNNLTDIYFAGTEAEWNGIGFGSGNNFPENATIHYNASLTCFENGHDYTSVTVPATCTADGSVTYTCTVCGETYSETIPAAHTPERTEMEATCTEDGMFFEVCSVCGEFLDSGTIPATGHTVVTDEAIEATCTEDGLTEGSHCSVCGEIFAAQETIPAMGHAESETCIENETSATCTESGAYDSVVYCTRCGEELSRITTVVPPLGHEKAEQLEVVEATCTEGGYTSYRCSRCGEEFADDETDPLGHDVYREEISPTCTKNGMFYEKCSRCGKTVNAGVLVSLGHLYSNEYTFDAQPTENTPGIKSRHCERCDAVTDETEVLYESGDANGDGKVNAKDLTLLKRFISGTLDENTLALLCADVNGDGKQNAKDITLIKKMIATGE